MIFNESTLTPHYQKFIYEKYNVLAHVPSRQIDHCLIDFEMFLQKLHKDTFLPNDRIVIEHMDTDYYHHELKNGIFISNLIKAFHATDIPTFVLLLITNHFGIKKEINELIIDKNDVPTVIETFFYQPHVQKSYKDIELTVDKIQMPALCLMGGIGRSHRHAFYDFVLKNELTDYIAVTKGKI
jgi:hypothetical protein